MTQPETESFQQKIAKWLERSGYPLEMDVAALVTKHGFSTYQSEYYLDLESRDTREIDVVGVLEAQDDVLKLRLTLAIECKTTKDKPWVVFTGATDGPGPYDVRDRAASTLGAAFLGRIASRLEIQQLPVFRLPRRVGYAVVRALSNGEDVPYAAMIGAAKAARSIAWEASGQRTRNRVAEVVLPVVVINGRLFECYLDATGERMLAEVPRATVYWRNPIAGSVHTVVSVITVGELEPYLDEVKQSFNSLTTSCSDDLAEAAKAIESARPGSRRDSGAADGV
ncbi:MAG: hypothetical protein ABI625_12710 [bacterium]